jgi:hypothetical protein
MRFHWFSGPLGENFPACPAPRVQCRMRAASAVDSGTQANPLPPMVPGELLRDCDRTRVPLPSSRGQYPM